MSIAPSRGTSLRRITSRSALTVHDALEDPHLTQVETRLAMSRHQLRRGALADAEARA